LGNDFYGVGGNDSFSTAGGDFEAHTGRIGYRSPCGVTVFEVDQPGGDFRFRRYFLKRFYVAHYAAMLEKGFKDL
jgi:hypothetical protein